WVNVVVIQGYHNQIHQQNGGEQGKNQRPERLCLIFEVPRIFYVQAWWKIQLGDTGLQFCSDGPYGPVHHFRLDGERADLVKPVQLRRSGSFVYLRKLIQGDKVSLIICKGQRFHIVDIAAVKGIQLDANIVLVLSVLQSRVSISCKSILHSRPDLA